MGSKWKNQSRNDFKLTLYDDDTNGDGASQVNDAEGRAKLTPLLAELSSSDPRSPFDWPALAIPLFMTKTHKGHRKKVIEAEMGYEQ